VGNKAHVERVTTQKKEKKQMHKKWHIGIGGFAAICLIAGLMHMTNSARATDTGQPATDHGGSAMKDTGTSPTS